MGKRGGQQVGLALERGFEKEKRFRKRRSLVLKFKILFFEVRLKWGKC